MKNFLKKIASKSDGCTHAPDLNFHQCCVDHDEHYSADSSMSRWRADIRLMKCIYKKGHPIIALIYFGAVRIFGKRHYVQKK